MNEPAPFSHTFHVRWSDLDSNAHMKNTAYLDLAGDVRMIFFRERGFGISEFERLRIGPVTLRDDVEYFREMRLLDEVTVTLALAGLSPDLSRFRLRNDLLSADGRLAARVTTSGGWLDLAARRLVPPPEGIARALDFLVRTDDYAPIEPPPRRS